MQSLTGFQMLYIRREAGRRAFYFEEQSGESTVQMRAEKKTGQGGGLEVRHEAPAPSILVCSGSSAMPQEKGSAPRASEGEREE